MLVQSKAKYYSDITTIYCKPRCRTVFLGRHTWQLSSEPVEAGEDCMISLIDLERIFSPDLRWKEENGKLVIFINDLRITATQGGGRVRVESQDETQAWEAHMGLGPRWIEGEWYLPMGGLFHGVLGAYFAVRAPYYMVSDELEEIDLKKAYLYMDMILSGKKTYGDFYKTIWYEPARRIVPYRIYIPTSYREGTPTKLIVGLHGANGNHNAVFERSRGELARLAEERGYMILAVNGLYYRSFYGYGYPTSGGVNSRNLAEDPKNPLMLTEEQKEERRLSQDCVMSMLAVTREQYTVDPQKIFLMGNSMGGAGCIWLAGQNPGIFRAVSPSGGNVSPKYFSVESLGKTPVFFVVGTEDEFGACCQGEAAAEFVSRGSDYTIYHVGGGDHSFAWTHVLDKVFDFFDKQ